MQRRKKLLLMAALLLLFFTLILSSSNAERCTKFEVTNMTFTRSDGASQFKAVTLGFNVTNKNTTEIFTRSPSGTVSQYVWNQSSRAFDLLSGNVAGLCGADSDRLHMKLCYNCTGSNKWEMYSAFQSEKCNGNVSLLQDEGWVNNATLAFTNDYVNSIDEGFTVIKDFPNKGNMTMMQKRSGSTLLLRAIYWDGSKWENHSLAINNTPAGYTFGSMQLIFNITGNNNYTLMPKGDPTKILNWNGSAWVNSSYLIPDRGVANTWDIMPPHSNWSGSNYTIVYGKGAVTTESAMYIGAFPYDGVQISPAVASTGSYSVGTKLNITANASSACNMTTFLSEVNASSGLRKNTSTEVYPSIGANATGAANVTISSCGAQMTTIRLWARDQQRNLNYVEYNVTDSAPKQYNITAGIVGISSLVCTSGTNATIVWNQSIDKNVTVTLNMSGIMLGNNQTCFYKANNVSQLRAVNKTSGCEVTLVNANARGNITVEQAAELGAERGGNLGIAIAAGSASAIVIAYVIARRRRAEE